MIFRLFLSISFFAVLQFASAEESASRSLTNDEKMRSYLQGISPWMEYPIVGRLAVVATIEGRQHILLFDAAQKTVSALISGAGNSFSPLWTPSGERILFISDRDGQSDIYIANWEGENIQRLTSDDAEESSLSLSRDGNRVFYGAKIGGKISVMSVSLAGGDPQVVLGSTKRITYPQISPSGEEIAYSTDQNWPGTDICLWRIAPKSESCVLSGRESFFAPSWSPDGSKLAFSLGAGKDVDIGILTLSTRKVSRIPSIINRELDATFSPDGEFLIFSAEVERKGVFQIYLHKIGDEKVYPLLKSPVPLRSPSWTKATTRELEVKRFKRADTVPTPLPSESPQAE